MISRKRAFRHLGYAWWRGCGWAWRGRYICKVCYPPLTQAQIDRIRARWADVLR